MPSKRTGDGMCQIAEQAIFDLPTQIEFQFKVTPGGETCLTILAEGIPFGNRDFVFGKDGMLAATGCGVNCRVFGQEDGK